MSVDWTKPIQLENGELCVLVETRPEGWTQWGARADGLLPTRCIKRLETEGMAAHWWVHEDGITGSRPEFKSNVINRP